MSEPARRTVRGVLAAALVAGIAVLVVTRAVQDPTPARPAARTVPASPSDPATPSAPPSAPSATPAASSSPVLEQPTGRRIPYREKQVGAAARDEIRFVDVTRHSGLAVPASSYAPRSYVAGMTSGIAVGQLAGRRVTLLTAPSGPPRLFAWSAGRFVDITRRTGLARIGVTTAAAFGDLNGDGHDDLVVGRELTGAVSIYLNDGHDVLRLSDRTGIPQRAAADYGTTAIRGIALGDVDGDGRVDIVTADWQLTYGDDTRPGATPDQGVCIKASRAGAVAGSRSQGQSRLYLGNGDGSFRDATRRWGLDLRGVHAFTPQLVDLDDNGTLDLVVTSDFCTSRVFLNEGDRRFRRVPPGSTAQMPPYGMGAVIGDFDRDGRPDWLATSISYPRSVGRCPYITTEAMGCSGDRLYLGRGAGRFADATAGSGLREAGWGWGVAAEDFGNTGRREVAITNGFLCQAQVPETFRRPCAYFGWDRTSFFVPTGEGHVNVATQVGLDDTSVGHALLAYDYDGDGRVDLLVNSSEGPRLFRNVTPTAGRHWLAIDLHDPTTPTNPSAWGSRIEVVTPAGTTRCWTTSSTSYETSWTGECHVGLGSYAGPVTVRVRWPGAVTTQTYTGVRPDAVRTLTRR